MHPLVSSPSVLLLFRLPLSLQDVFLRPLDRPLLERTSHFSRRARPARLAARGDDTVVLRSSCLRRRRNQREATGGEKAKERVYGLRKRVRRGEKSEKEQENVQLSHGRSRRERFSLPPDSSNSWTGQSNARVGQKREKLREIERTVRFVRWLHEGGR